MNERLASDLESLLADICMELDCEPDNEAILKAISDLKVKAWKYDELCK